MPKLRNAFYQLPSTNENKNETTQLHEEIERNCVTILLLCRRLESLPLLLLLLIFRLNCVRMYVLNEFYCIVKFSITTIKKKSKKKEPNIYGIYFPANSRSHTHAIYYFCWFQKCFPCIDICSFIVAFK